MKSGKSGAEALANALNKVADKLMDIALNSIFDSKGGLFGGGLFGGIGKLFGFANGGIAANGRPQPIKTFARGGISRSAAIFGEAGPEAAVPLPDGRRIPVDLRMNSARGGTETVKVVLQDDSGRMAAIADQRIQTNAGPMIQISVQQSTKAIRNSLPSMIADAQTRKM